MALWRRQCLCFSRFRHDHAPRPRAEREQRLLGVPREAHAEVVRPAPRRALDREPVAVQPLDVEGGAVADHEQVARRAGRPLGQAGAGEDAPGAAAQQLVDVILRLD